MKWNFETWNEPDCRDFDKMNMTVQGKLIGFSFKLYFGRFMILWYIWASTLSAFVIHLSRSIISRLATSEISIF